MNYDDSIYESPVKHNIHPPHYYGDFVRRLFMAGAIGSLLIMLVDRTLIVVYLTFGVGMALFLVLLAGFTSPRNKWALYCDLLISSVAFIFFEYLAVAQELKVDTIFNIVFLARQTIAIIFVVAAYYSAKTVRGAR